MNTTTRKLRFEDLESTLRDLDAAESTGLDARRDPRAQAVLNHVLQSRAPDPPAEESAGDHAPSRPTPASPSARGRLARRSLAVATVAAVITVGSIAVPNFYGGGEAIAWSATPQPVSADLLHSAEQACTDQVIDDPSPVEGVDRSRMRPVISDARGSYILVFLTDRAPSPSSSTCYVQGGRVVGMTGSMATAASPVEPPVPEDSVRLALGAVTSTPAGSIRGVTGRVGPQVVGVVLDSVAQGPVTATVRNGHVAAWWPDLPTTEARENALTAPEITGATLTLRDGSTRWASVEELSGRTTEELSRPDTGGSAPSAG
ncbi:hypothetical protein [Intrasporangium sp.]|uniref:hypothetical protein n=1 Tax=Intrasporangium sp. TaxID=1925024 RepID=UPI00293B41F9|nr:hypothetical protein [Intrasporangium sp.]MDV3222485.1 hypothetical protein [Intrasporangium sp.]